MVWFLLAQAVPTVPVDAITQHPEETRVLIKVLVGVIVFMATAGLAMGQRQLSSLKRGQKSLAAADEERGRLASQEHEAIRKAIRDAVGPLDSRLREAEGTLQRYEEHRRSEDREVERLAGLIETGLRRVEEKLDAQTAQAVVTQQLNQQEHATIIQGRKELEVRIEGRLARVESKLPNGEIGEMKRMLEVLSSRALQEEEQNELGRQGKIDRRRSPRNGSKKA